jgi:hypothetical protein
MRLSEPKNFFDTYKFCDVLAKVFGVQFTTIKRDKLGKYFTKTSNFDILRGLIGILLGIWITKYILEITMEVNSGRSIIFEIMTVANGKFQGDHGFLVLILFLILHKHYFKILYNIYEIDGKVSNLTLN